MAYVGDLPLLCASGQPVLWAGYLLVLICGVIYGSCLRWWDKSHCRYREQPWRRQTATSAARITAHAAGSALVVQGSRRRRSAATARRYVPVVVTVTQPFTHPPVHTPPTHTIYSSYAPGAVAAWCRHPCHVTRRSCRARRGAAAVPACRTSVPARWDAATSQVTAGAWRRSPRTWNRSLHGHLP